MSEQKFEQNRVSGLVVPTALLCGAVTMASYSMNADRAEAQSEMLPNPNQQMLIDESMQIARAEWAVRDSSGSIQSPCMGTDSNGVAKLSVVISSREEIKNMRKAVDSDANDSGVGHAADGLAQLSSCRMILPREIFESNELPSYRCAVINHEFGHFVLNNGVHSASRTNIMSGSGLLPNDIPAMSLGCAQLNTKQKLSTLQALKRVLAPRSMDARTCRSDKINKKKRLPGERGYLCIARNTSGERDQSIKYYWRVNLKTNNVIGIDGELAKGVSRVSDNEDEGSWKANRKAGGKVVH